MAPVRGNFRERHKHETTEMHQRMGQNEGATGAGQCGPIEDPTAVVDDIQIQWPAAPARSQLTTSTAFHAFQEAEEGTYRPVGAYSDNGVIEGRHQTRTLVWWCQVDG